MGTTPSAPEPGRPAHCILIAIDFSAAGSNARSDQVAVHVRKHLRRILAEALDACGIQPLLCQDRGTSLLILVESVAPVVLVGPLIENLRGRLRRYNTMSSDAAQIHLRIAENVGSVYIDATDVISYAIDRLYRLLDAPDFLAKLAGIPSELSLIICDYLYEDVVRHTSCLYEDLVRNTPTVMEPDAYQPIQVVEEEGEIRAWVYFPPRVTPSCLPGEVASGPQACWAVG